MKKTYILLILILLSALYIGCKKKESTGNCKIEGYIDAQGIYNKESAVKVTFVGDSTGIKNVAITDTTGKFEFIDLMAGKYNFKVEKENYHIYMYKDDDDIYPPMKVNKDWNTVELKEGMVKRMEITMKSDYEVFDSFLYLTDMYGNRINETIHIPKNSTTLALKLYNETEQSAHFSVNYDNCAVAIHCSEEYHDYLENYFDSIIPSSGVVEPGENVMIVCYINQNIYNRCNGNGSYGYYYGQSYNYNILDIYPIGNISLDFEF